MRYDLIGYLTGALDPHEAHQVERALLDDSQLRAELDRLRRTLEPLDRLAIVPRDAAPDLVDRTLATLPSLPDQHRTPPSSTPESSASIASASASDAYSNFMGEVSASPRSAATHRSLDVAAVAMAAAVAFAIGLPVIQRYRERARRAVCADNLRQLGTSLVQFVDRSPRHHFPAVARSGNQSFAGIYAVHLSDAGLLNRPVIRWCPDRTKPSVTKARRAGDPIGAGPTRLPTLASIQVADANQLRFIQQTAGGHYAYTLGVRDESGYRPPTYESRANFAVLSDLPDVGDGHVGGVNVLYEDGSVRFVNHDALATLPDHPFENHERRPEAGVTIDDASLAPSWRPPFVDALQR